MCRFHCSRSVLSLPLAAVVGLLVVAVSSAADGPVNAESLIADLASSDFTIRQQATSQLQEAGQEALPHIVAAIRSTNSETRSRAWNILLTHALSNRLDIREAARAAVRQLEDQRAGGPGPVLRGGLARIREAISNQAAVELTRLGAMTMPPTGGPPLTFNVQLGQGWHGGDDELTLLADLGSIPWLSLENSRVTDAALGHIAKLGEPAPGLTKLYLGSSGITGSDFSKLAPLKRLQYLSLKHLPLDDTRLATLPIFPDLQYLGLDGTKIGDASLAYLNRFPRLQILWLDNTRITDAGLVHLKNLQYLDTIYMPGTATGGLGLAELRYVPKLKSLSLKGVRLAFDSLKALVQVEQLESLGLDMTDVTDPQLADLAGLKQLRVLWLNGTTIGDDGLEHLKHLHSLQIVHLNNTLVTREGVAELERALPRCQITVDLSPRTTLPFAPNPRPPLVQPIVPRPTAP